MCKLFLPRAVREIVVSDGARAHLCEHVVEMAVQEMVVQSGGCGDDRGGRGIVGRVGGSNGGCGSGNS
jgi:hypothetical protein